jgi:hypothetical protein
MTSDLMRRLVIATALVPPAGGLAAQTGETVPDRRCTDPVPEIQALMQNEAMEKHPGEEVEQLIEEASELCEQGETEEALYKLFEQIGAVRQELAEQIGAVRRELARQISETRSDLMHAINRLAFWMNGFLAALWWQCSASAAS